MSHFRRLTRIVHPTDFSDGSEVAFAHALKLACGASAEIDIVHVESSPEHMDNSRFLNVHQRLIDWGMLPEGSSREDVAKLGIRVLKATMIDSDPVHGLVSFLKQHRADLVVMATHQRHGFARWLHKEVAHKVARLTWAPTLFVPFDAAGFVDAATGECLLDHVLFPVDETPHPQPGINLLEDVMGAMQCQEPTISVCHVGKEDFDVPKLRYPAHPSWNWEMVVRPGNVVDEILEVAEQKSAQLIAMTTAGHHGFLDAFRGTTTDRVVHDAPCPVLAVPSLEPIPEKQPAWFRAVEHAPAF